MSDKEYIHYLSLERADRFRYRHTLKSGHITYFSVQYEALIDNEWVAIVRYDSAHGRAHKDILHPFEREMKEEFYGQSFADVLTMGERDIKTNWKKYRDEYESKMKEKKQ